ncbi:MAG: hypothetical protein FWE02_03890 [Defluviitaleaceae bacterium]|nr:hypothetical protein [Defluviitaleaceae bacterium]
MAILIQEPRDSNPETSDWQKILYRTTKSTGGFTLIDLFHTPADNLWRIIKGSRFEFNGVFYATPEHEVINNIPEVSNGSIFFIYAELSAANTIATFHARNTPPIWDIARAGWFNGSSKALFIGYKNNNGTLSAIERIKSEELPTLNIGMAVAGRSTVRVGGQTFGGYKVNLQRADNIRDAFILL